MVLGWFCFFFKQKTAYEWRISDWSSDVCSSDLVARHPALAWLVRGQGLRSTALRVGRPQTLAPGQQLLRVLRALYPLVVPGRVVAVGHRQLRQPRRTPLDQRRVDLGDVRVQQVERPAIPDDVVRHEEQRVLLLGKLEQLRAEQRRP